MIFIQERELLWQGEVHTGESTLVLMYIAYECRRMLESPLFGVLSRCPFYMSFSCRVFSSYVISSSAD
jgi:uncharacterized membrane protein